MIDKPKILVLMGGISAEREVSLKSGRSVAEALRQRGYQVMELDVRNEKWEMPPGIDLVFIALHGTYGEDGTVQSYLEAMNVPYTGSGPEASRIAFDKVLAKHRYIECGIPTPDFTVVRDLDAPLPTSLALPLVVKPARQGSSVGVSFVENPSQWADALREAFKYDSVVLVEKLIRGREVTVGILGDTPLPIVEIKPLSGRYDYRSKYTPGATQYECPAQLDAATTARVQQTALAVYRAIGCRDYARVDLILSEDGQPYVLEINTLPGMTSTSLLPKAALAAGINYPELCEIMVNLALNRVRKLEAR